MARIANFNAGPAALPTPVLERARDELLDFQGTGMSIMEHSHRGKAYEAVHDEAISLLRELLAIPGDYHVLFLQGGASTQFAVVPMNLLHPSKTAGYVLSGHWSDRAHEEAQVVGKARVVASTAGVKHTRVPAQAELALEASDSYVHITTNNTIEGTQFFAEPDVGATPLVADMSSDFLWRKHDVSRYGLIYAGAQKNLGPSGVVCVIARKDLVDGARKDIPKIFQYATHAKANSLFHTPPTFAIYLVRGVLAWIKDQGGLAGLEARNRDKASALYAAIDDSGGFYRCPVDKGSRSVMNVVFRLMSEALEERFVKEASAQGMAGLKGHRSVGGIRASIYNAVSLDDVRKLTAFMKDFARRA